MLAVVLPLAALVLIPVLVAIVLALVPGLDEPRNHDDGQPASDPDPDRGEIMARAA